MNGVNGMQRQDVREESASRARLLIADDHALVREGIRAVLEAEPDLEVVGEARDGREAVRLCGSLQPELVLMDVRMPGMDGLAATRAIKEQWPRVSVMMVTMHESPEYLLEAVRAGAAGYILKDAAGERMVEAVRRTLGGESSLDEGLAMGLLVRLAGDRDEEGAKQAEGRQAEGRPATWEGGDLPEGLTAREVEVLGLLARGRTNPQIAESLEISRGTAKIHVQHIIAKLGVSDRTQAAVRAIELGLFLPETRR
ncbi:MAG: response regulator transcription factor [Actinomycetota bacterium]|nr:response regulator transcription factor [Actinomycetota bacterium]